MKLGGIQKLTLLDYPEHVACTIFTKGCNLRCPFCHNSSLVMPDLINETEDLPVEDVMEFLEKRKGRLDGVCVTGGEPLLQPDIKEFIKCIKDMGFLVKLDTNGSFPEKLKELVDEHLIDYAAMDIKSSPAEYAKISGTTNPPIERMQESMRILKESGIGYEFRTTIVEEFHNEEVMEDIGKFLAGAPKYYLQRFVDSGELIDEGLHPVKEERLEKFLEIVQKYVPDAKIRGSL